MRKLISKEGKWLLWILVITALIHGLNMFRYPYYENDEGIYMSQAWSVLKEGKLSPYTYWYDHAPAGWLLIAAWLKITGGLFSFGPAINSGRVMMLGVQLINTILLYFLVKETTHQRGAAIIAAAIFSLSPLGIYYQRRVLLDNLVVTWVLGALAVIILRKFTIWSGAAAALMLGIAMLTKEVAIFFLPGVMYAISERSGKNKAFAVTLSLAIFGMTGSFYVLYALLKGELWPTAGKVSLFGAWMTQISRGINRPFWAAGSIQIYNWQDWLWRDPLLPWLAVTGLILGAVAAIRIKTLRVPVICGWGFAIFLLTSKLIIGFYILPLLPFAAWYGGAIGGWIVEKMKFKYLKITAGILIAGGLGLNLVINNKGLFNRDENLPQRETVDYIKTNLPPESRIAADSSIYLDLREARGADDKKFTNVEWAWKVEEDPAIKTGKLKQDWRNLDYLIVSHEVFKQMREFKADFLTAAMNFGEPIKIYKEGSTSYIDMDKHLSTNGDWMGIYKIKDPQSIELDQAWSYYKQHFIYSYGQVMDPATGATTSEGQAYALLRSVWSNDKKTFDGVWQWTTDHMQHRKDDKLLSWIWQQDKLADPESASDADIDIAMALLMAHKQWGDEQYMLAADELVADIWRKEVVNINNRYYLTAGSNFKRQNGYVINPSYFSPAAYVIFQEADLNHPWLKLRDDTYWLLNDIGQLADNPSGLPPNWLWINEKSGKPASAATFGVSNADLYGYDAFRTYWRIALDAEWFKASAAQDYLRKGAVFFSQEQITGKRVAAIYDLQGQRVVDYTSLATYTAPLAVFAEVDPGQANTIFDQVYKVPGPNWGGYWGDPNNYYDQNWAWFATAMYYHRLPNLWRE